MAGKSVLLVVCIVEARQFPSRADCSVVVEGRLGREGLATDPVPQDRGNIKVGQELAWSMTRKALQQHRVQRSPLKLQVYSLDNATNVRQLLGYALMDIRAAQVGKQKLNWCSLLGPGHAPGSRPQLLVSVSLEEEEERQPTEGGGAGEGLLVREPSALADDTAQHTLTLALAKGGGYYTLGPPSSHQQTFTLSLTLTNPRNIPQPPTPNSQLYFYYCLLGNDITSEPFVPLTFQPERASIRVCSSWELVQLLMAAQEDMQLHLCSGPQSLAFGQVPLKLLGARDHIHMTLQLAGEGGRKGATPLPTVEVTLQLESCDSLPSSPSPLPSLTQAPGESEKPPCSTHGHPHAHTGTTAARLTPSPSSMDGATSPIPPPSPHPPSPHPPSSHSLHPPNSTKNLPQSAKRNLTKSFEEADSNPTTPTATPTSLHGTLIAHHPPPTASLATPTTHETIPTTQMWTGSARVHLSAASPSKTSTLTFPPIKTVAHPPTLTTGTATSAMGHLLTLTTGPASSTMAHPLTVTSGAPFSSQSPAQAVPSSSHKTTGGWSMGVVSPANSAHHFRFSIDTRSIHNVNMGDGLQCYLRYSYPFFGSSQPVLVTPPVATPPNTERTFSQSYCAFDFATSSHQLVQQLHSQPLCVEVWHLIGSSPASHNELVGVAKVPLSEVLSHEKMKVGGASRQLCALWVPITPVQLPTATKGLAPTPTGYLHTVLVLEDHGSVRITGGGGVAEGEVQRESTAQMQPIMVQEYQAALELEMWKLSQEEAWQADLRGREADHMSQLAAEWQRRDQQRQQLLREKLSVYSSLEQQLREALKEVQLQRQQFKDREGELSLERTLLSRDRQSLQDECQRRLREEDEIHQQQLLQERHKVEQLQSQVTRLKTQVDDLEGRCATKEAEFEAYRRQVSTQPESRLQAELSMAQLEKGELERKLSSVLKSKQHYKEQWSNTLKELASLRQREQAAAREHLHQQQEELEVLRTKFLQQREQQQLRAELSSTRTQLQVLQERTLAQNSTEEEKPSTNAPPLGGEALSPGISIDPAVARWIEERDILLQTGVYSSSDPTIARLDQKIREALAHVTHATPSHEP